MLYAEADADECRQAVDGAPEEIRGVFADMQRAKRATCPTKAFEMRPEDLAERPKCEIQKRLADWRSVRHTGSN